MHSAAGWKNVWTTKQNISFLGLDAPIGLLATFIVRLN
jgi:hypothetical protein